MAMNTSDWISLVALATSIVAGVFNYYYTRRSFEAGNYPDLFVGGFKAKSAISVERKHALKAVKKAGMQVDPKDYFISAASLESSIYFSLRNQSHSVAVTAITVKIYLVRLFLFFGKSYQIGAEQIEMLGPGQAKEISFHGVQKQISAHVPGLYEQAEGVWLLKAPRELNLRVTVKYKPAIRGGRFVSVTYRYAVTPRSDNPHTAFWDVREM